MALHLLETPLDLPSPLDQLEDIGTALPASNDFSLDDLLAESLREKKIHESVKDSRTRLAKGGLASEERLAVEAQVRAWELRREWLPAAAVVMFSRQQCNCCKSFSTQFLGFFQRQQHRSSKIDRWIPSVMPRDSLLPREAKYQDSLTELCENCAEHLGFEVEES